MLGACPTIISTLIMMTHQLLYDFISDFFFFSVMTLIRQASVNGKDIKHFFFLYFTLFSILHNADVYNYLFRVISTI